jgi:hypothetical protein
VARSAKKITEAVTASSPCRQAGPGRCGKVSDGTIRRGSEIHVELMEFQVHLKVEFEIEDDGTELEIELTW